MDIGKFTLMKLTEGRKDVSAFFLKDKWYEDPWVLQQIYDRIEDDSSSEHSPSIMVPYMMFLVGDGERFKEMLKTWPAEVAYRVIGLDDAPEVFSDIIGYGHTGSDIKDINTFKDIKDLHQAKEFWDYYVSLVKAIFEADLTMSGYRGSDVLTIATGIARDKTCDMFRKIKIAPNLVHDRIWYSTKTSSPQISLADAKDSVSKVKKIVGYLKDGNDDDSYSYSYYGKAPADFAKKRWGKLLAQVKCDKPDPQHMLDLKKIPEKAKLEMLRRIMEYKTTPTFQLRLKDTELNLVVKCSYQRTQYLDDAARKKLDNQLPKVVSTLKKAYGVDVAFAGNSDDAFYFPILKVPVENLTKIIKDKEE